MIRLAFITLTALALWAFGGCENSTDATPAPHADAHHHDDDDHDHGHDDDHDHGHDDHEHDHDHGKATSLGTADIDGVTIRATQLGDVDAGEEATIEVHLESLPEGVHPSDLTLRTWIGTEHGLESIKARADYDAPHRIFHAHVEAPSPLPAGSLWWVELEIAGREGRASFDLGH